ncbi:MAG: lipopolysaccharide biosynthesis protein [PVC group bacterium]
MNDSNRQKIRRVALGSLVTFAGNLITIIERVILVPLFLKFWGTEPYGEWLSLAAAVSYMSMLELGVQSYVINKLNQCYSTGRSDEYIYILHSALMVSVIVCSSVIVFIALILPVFPLERWFHFIHTGHSLAVLVTFLLAIQIVVKIPCGIITGLYRTFGEFPRGAMIGNVQVLLVFLITGTVIISGGGFALLALLQLVPISLIVLYVFRDIGRRHPEVHLGFKGGSLKKGFSFLIPGSCFFLIQISTLMGFSGSTIIVATQLGPAAVVVFSTLRTLANVTKQIPQAINIALWPELTSLEAQKQYETLKKTHFFIVKIGFLISFCLAIIIHFAGKELVTLWTRGRISYDSQLMNIFLGYIVLQIIWSLSGTFQAAFNRPGLVGMCTFASMVTGLTLAYFLTRRYGTAGTVGGLFIAEGLICGVALPLRTCRILGESTGAFIRGVIVRALPGVVVLYLWAYWLWKVIKPFGTPGSVFLFGAVVLLSGMFMGYYFYLNRQERIILSPILTSLRGKLRCRS